MAKFLKIVSADANDPEVMIGIDQVTHVAAGDAADPVGNLDTNVTVFYSGGSCTVAFAAQATAGDVLKAFNAALVANPGGLVSTVGRPVLTAQTLDSVDGRQLITAEATYVSYSGVTFA